MSETKYEIVKFVDNDFELEVNVSPVEETVWLTAEEMAVLFDVQRPAIVKHTVNIVSSGELEASTCSILEQVHFEGSRKVTRKSNIYNLDMIIAVGYRVNSKRGTLFRRWANKVLKQYLFKGYAIDSSRVLVTQENYLNLVNIVNRIDDKQIEHEARIEKLEDKLPKITQKLFFKGQMWDATSLIEDIIIKAKEEIILIDNYIDKKTLDLLVKKKKGVAVNIHTSEKGNKLTVKEITDFNNQYGLLNIRYTDEFHDRFMILDKETLYHIGSSIKDAGKKAFEISIIEDEKQLDGIIERL